MLKKVVSYICMIELMLLQRYCNGKQKDLIKKIVFFIMQIDPKSGINGTKHEENIER